MNIWTQRAYDVLVKNKWLIKGWPQGLQTARTDQNDYSFSSNRENLIMIPGYLCNQWTYVNLLNKINKDSEFNLVNLENFPQWWKAMFDTSSIEESSRKLLEIVDKVDWNWVNLVWHSFGWVIWVFAGILAEEKWIKSGINKILTLSSPLNWSKAISQLPIVKGFYKSIQDMAPESAVIRAIQDKGQVDKSFVTTQDEIFPMEEMDFHRGEEHVLHHWHFDYAHGKKHVIANTAEKIQTALLTA